MNSAVVVAGLVAVSVTALLWTGFAERKLDHRADDVIDALRKTQDVGRPGRDESAGRAWLPLLARAFLPSKAVLNALQMAGFRGPNSVHVYNVGRVLGFAIFGAVIWTYLNAQTAFDVKGPLLPALSVLAGAVGWQLPTVLVKNRILKRQQAMQRAWPNAMDLLLVCVESGTSLEQSLKRVVDEIGAESIDLAEELTITLAELSYLPDRRMAYDNLVSRTGIDSIRSVASALKQAERHGTSLGGALRVLAQESRDLRLAAAEKKAAALPPKLTVPMILFFLPVLFAAILAPAIIQIMSK